MPRWLKFYAVGAAGLGAQLSALSLLHGVLRMEYLAATALAVEVAVLHNFVWHERWTWRRGNRDGIGFRLLRFHLSTSAVSIATNVVRMGLLVGRLHIQFLIANLLAVALASLANYAAAEWFVFTESDR
jgi:putative flippase GtrA